MTTGTEGPDNLQNDRFVTHEVIDALGGGDTITIVAPDFQVEEQPTITVHGDGGADTLVMNDVVLAGGSATAAGGTINGYVSTSMRYDVFYDGIENIYISGGIRHGPLAFGATTDELHLYSVSFVTSISLGAGDDKLYLTGTFDSLTIDGGDDDDLIDVSGTNAEFPAEYDIRGGAGNDMLVSSTLAADQLQGGTGDDDYVVNGAAVDVIELDGDGTDTVTTSLEGYTLTGFVENLTLTGTAVAGYGNGLGNVLTGSAIANRLYGLGGSDTIDAGSGNDWLDGGSGADALSGGTGDDAYWIDDAGDQVIEAAGEGADKVFSSLFRTDLGSNVENLELIGSAVSGYGNGLNNMITGNAGDNALYGLDGNDRLDGGLGADRLSGGNGDDTYYVDNIGDRALEAFASGGTDTVHSAVSFSLAYQHIERLFLTGTADIDATGNSLANTLVGNGGANLIDGGAGVDVMNGGAGNDVYIVDETGDTVIEVRFGGWNDVVRSSATFYISNAYEIETLVLTGTAAINGYGNEQVNRIEGNSNNNVLNGGGAADTLVGKGGNDTYYVDSLGETVIEAAGEGIDTVYSSVRFSAFGQAIENVFLTGTASIDAAGNELDNRLYGNSGNNVLDGWYGNDVMVGGAGDDVYFVLETADRVIEHAGEGNDRVDTWADFSLAGTHVEKLVLRGSGPVAGTGNSLANSIISWTDGSSSLRGLGGDDILDSDSDNGVGHHLYGGTGNDTLISHASDEDRFYFDTALDAANNVDTIDGFDTVGYDQFQLSRAIFTQIDAGLLSEDAFHTGTAAADAEDRIVYDIATGKVYYDADGSGAAAAVLFAQVDPGAGLAYYHFFAY